MISVIYVDDEPALLDLLSSFLEEVPGFNVRTSASAREAIEMMREEPCDVIISDYQMDGMDGIAFLKHVRAHQGDVPFILFTGRGREEVAVQALNLGADFYMQKGGDAMSMLSELQHMVVQADRRAKAEKAQRESEKRLALALDASSEGIWDWDVSADRAHLSPRFHTMLGYGEEDVPERFTDWRLLIHPEDRDRCIGQVRDCLDGRSPIYESEFRAKAKDGTYRWILSRGRVVERSPDRRPLRMVGTHVDITEAVNRRIELQQSEALLRGLFDTINSGVAIYEVRGSGEKGQDYIIKDFNQTSLALEGRAKEEVVGKSLSDLRPNIDQYGLIEIFRKVWLTGEPAYFPTKMYVDDNYSNWYENKVFKLPSGEIVAIYDDVTERIRAEQSLRLSEERWSFALEGSRDGVWDLDLETGEVFYSHRWKEMLGYSDEDIGSQKEDWAVLIHPEDRARANERTKLFLGGEVPEYVLEHRVRCKDGSYKWILARGKVLRWRPDGTPARVLGTHTDITEWKRAEEALRHANMKLTLLSSITRHDIQNRLTVLMGSLALIRRRTQDSSILAHLDQSEWAAQAIQREVAYARDYEVIGDQPPQWQDVGAIVSSLTGSHLRLRNEVYGLHVYADPLLNKVFENLLDNSTRHGVQATEVAVWSEPRGDGMVLVWEDDGMGIPEKDKERIFLRGVGRNTGLGLCLVREVLAITGLEIRETGAFGRGARFEIFLPRGTYRTEAPSPSIDN